MKSSNKELIAWFENIGIEDIALVGGKNAALGEMMRELKEAGVTIPRGFAVTTNAYRRFLEANDLDAKIQAILKDLDTDTLANLKSRGKRIRALIVSSAFPLDVHDAIVRAYATLSRARKQTSVAVRSSATTEDLPTASFAGQQDTFLNISGADGVLLHIKKCFASLFTDRAISYRVHHGFSTNEAYLSVGVQTMVRSDIGVSGVMFSLDTETGFDKVITINASYGLGEAIVQGAVTPDEFIVFKPFLDDAKLNPIIGKKAGKKDIKAVWAKKGTKTVAVSKIFQHNFSLTDREVLKLAKLCVIIEQHFYKKHGHVQHMDIEWAKDGQLGKFFIVQARPETVHATTDAHVYHEYHLKKKGAPLVSGAAIGSKIAHGSVRVIKDSRRIAAFKEGEVLVTEITDPDWEPVMKKAAGIVTDRGGRTSHAAIVSRELGIPAIVGAEGATKKLSTGQRVTVDCSSGATGDVYEGELPFETTEYRLDAIPNTKTKVMVNIGAPPEAFRNFRLPAQGVGLGRLEFIISSYIQMHPNVLVQYAALRRSRDKKIQRIVKIVEERTAEYKDKKQFYIDELAYGIAKIAAVFHPHDVIIRFSDFKTNEYRTLLGGELFEPVEANPMMGWRGAARYYDPAFAEAFGLECKAIAHVRGIMGFRNVIPMVPFCRTPDEGAKVVARMNDFGLSRKDDNTLKIYVMCELPSNVISANEFLDIFDGMSIGSNDLTQLTLGLDRDAGTLAHIGNENEPAVRTLIAMAIDACKKRGKYVGICGQAPSDFPDFAEFLVEHGIDSISLNPDAVLTTLPRIAAAEA